MKASLLRLLGDSATHGDEFDADENADRCSEALALAEPRHVRPLIADCHAGLPSLYRRTARPAESDKHFQIATTMYREMDMTHWLEKAEAEMRSLRADEGPP